MALKLPTPPTPPTPPTIDRGEATDSTPKIDAHQFFEVPFKRKENPVAQEEISPPIPEKKAPTPEDLAREAVANGAGPLTKRTVTRPADEEKSETPRPVQVPANSNFAENPRDGKAILREFQNDDFQTARETPRNFNVDQQESHGGIFWIITLIFVSIASIVFVKKFMLKKKPARQKSSPLEDSTKRLSKISAPKNDDDKGKHFEVRI